ncbi:trafficking protein particle complex subunit 9-like [Ptychodera flava]|uniref:trafficking protein particle complex subunit 9-like n=1 Tax=Ptychodera flava TaxID=63121 RepID=UPI00396A27E4
MSYADYSQRVEDHQALLVLLKAVGPHKTKAYNKIFDRISRETHVRLSDGKRRVCLRYKRNVPQANSDWGEFQCHRKVLGLLCIGKCTSDGDLANIEANFDSLKEGYKNTLYNSRCMVFGNTGGGTNEQSQPQQGRPDFVFYQSFEDCVKLEDQVREFAASLFWVLESKRLDKSSDKGDRAPLLMAPFEKRDFVGIDTESRNYKKRIQGRMRKHVGDLCLQAGMTQDAFIHYQAAADTLKSANDWLWLAGAYEGMCSASVITLYPETTKPAFSRNLTFHGSPARVQNIRLKTSTYTANGFSDTFETKPPKNCLAGEEIIEKYRDAIVQYSKYKNAGIVEMEASIKATRVLIQQNKYLEASDFLQNVVYINLSLSDEEKIQRYSTLSVLYSQIGFHRKASFYKRVAAMQCVSPQNPHPGWVPCHNLLLQSLEGYKLPLDPRENPTTYVSGWPVVQLRVLHELVYTAKRMGNPALAVRHMCFMLHTLFDHMTQNERKEMCTVLESYTAKCPGTPTPLALENGTIIPGVPLNRFPTVKSFKLSPLSSHLQPHESGSSGAIKTPPITNSPFIYSPIQPQTKVDGKAKSKTKMAFQWVEGDTCEIALQVNNPLPFELKVDNMGLLAEGLEFDPIPASFSLPAESGPYPVAIHGSPKGSGTLKIVGYISHVLGVKSHCRLRDIQAVSESFYEVEVVPALPQLKINTSLPQNASVKASSTINDAMLSSVALTLLAGESQECAITLQNCGKVPLESIAIAMDKVKSKDVPIDSMFSWSEENIKTQLPVQPGSSLTFTVYIKAIGDFIAADAILPEETPTSPLPYPEAKSKVSKPGNPDSKGTHDAGNSEMDVNKKIIDATLRIQYSGGPGLKASYQRVATVGIKLTVQPSVMLTRWTTIPAKSPSQFHLIVDMVNQSGHEMIVQYGDDTETTLESKQKRRIGVLVERFSLVEKKKDGLLARDGGKDNLIKLYAQQLASLVDIRWKILSNKKSGCLPIDGLYLSQYMVHHMRQCPVQWEVTLNGTFHALDEPVNFNIAEPINVNVKVTNDTGVTVGPSVLTIQPYLDQQNSTHETQLDSSVLCIGQTSIKVAEIPVDGSAQHSCSFLFLCCGNFKLGVTCMEIVEETLKVDLESAPSIETPNSGQIWRYRPTVDLNITDKQCDD